MVVEEGGGWTVEVGAQGVEVGVGVGAGSSSSSSGRWGGRSRCRGVAHVYEEGLEGERERVVSSTAPARPSLLPSGVATEGVVVWGSTY